MEGVTVGSASKSSFFVGKILWCFLAIASFFSPLGAHGQSPQSLPELRDALERQGLTPESFDLMLNEVQRLHYAKQVVAIADYTLSSREKRLFVFNLKTFEFSTYYVAHGMKSGGEYAQFFSNKVGSRMSSLGFQTTLAHYGSFGSSFSLKGLSASNSNIQSRAILIHGAEFVSDSFMEKYGFLGRSEGCLSVSYADIGIIMQKLGVGGLVLSYQKDLWQMAQDHPDAQALAGAQPVPPALAWELEENTNGQNGGRHIGYYKNKY